MYEDHFDLPQDMENYMEYHLMGSVSQVRTKVGCMPTKFDCQPDRKSQTSNTIERPFIAKKPRMMVVEECEKDLEESSIVTQHSEPDHVPTESAGSQMNEEFQHELCKTADKSIQVHRVHTFRSKANQTAIQSVHQASSPIKTCHLTSVSTSPLKLKTRFNRKTTGFNRLISSVEETDSDILYTPTVTRLDSSPSTSSFQIASNLVIKYL